MGNCWRSNRVMAYSPATEAKKVERVSVTGSAMARRGVRGKKAVRFELQEDEICGDGRGGIGGVVRIKVVMSRNELKRILKDEEKESGGFEKLIGELVVKGRTRMVVSDAGIEEVEDENGRWSPALESIPEQCLD